VTTEPSLSIAIPPELLELLGPCVTSAGPLAQAMSLHLAHHFLNAAERLTEAMAEGHRVMLCIDVDSQEPQVRLVTVDPAHHLTQHLAMGAALRPAALN
jgi:hypothetical protein